MKLLKFLGPIIILLVPVYFWIKYLERKIKPRESVGKFFLWVGIAVGSSFIYYLLCLFIFVKFFLVKHNA